MQKTRTPSPLSPSSAAQELTERGYVTFEKIYTEAEIDFLRAHLISYWETIGKPLLYTNPPYSPAPDVVYGPAGLLFLKLATKYPDLAPRLFKPKVIAAIRQFLGEDMHLELNVATLSDRARPFFDWHVHIGAVDEAYYNHNRPFPSFERPERVIHLLYLDGLSKDNGPLLVLPRKITDPTSPPFDTKLTTWPGQVEVTCPPGSVVVMEQCTWHAVCRMQTPGTRAFVGSYFAASDAPPTPWADESLVDWKGNDALFRSLLPRRS